MTLSDRCKEFENIEAQRTLIPKLPILVRLDGRAFHTYTRGLERPYDTRLQTCMIETTKQLVEQFDAKLGYTQSDEISLLFNYEEPAQPLFKGRQQKIVSVLSSACTVYFKTLADKFLPKKSHLFPQFDCRVWNVPNIDEVYLYMLWREDDATRNSITMAAQSVYSHKQLLHKNRNDMHEMLHEKGINWNDYPSEFKRGIYLKRQQFLEELSEEQLKKIPKDKIPENGKVIRSRVVKLDLRPVKEIDEEKEWLFE